MLRKILPAVVVLAFAQVSHTRACPLCDALGAQTISEQIETMEVVAVGRLTEIVKEKTTGLDGSPTEVPKARFAVEQIIKGAEILGRKNVIELTYFGEVERDASYLLMGVDPPQISWIAPEKLSPRGLSYIQQVVKLPKSNSQRLLFFQEYLEDDDPLIARDAFDEFATAPYDDIAGIQEKLHHDQLVAWIQSPDIPANRKRLYLMMLSTCGTEDDLPMLEGLLTAEDRSVRQGLDSMIACYLMLKGPAGMKLIEEQFFKDTEAAYTDTYAAIMAMRFLGTEASAVPRERILEALRHVLDRPKLADLTIPDFARWEDWSVMDEMVKLFKEAETNKTTWVRVPVINYLKACPLPKAKEHLEELKKIDPDAFRRANSFFPYGGAVEPQRS